MTPPQPDTASDVAVPLWLIGTVAVCLPVTLIVLWRIGRWWRSGEPLPMPADGPPPDLPWPPWFGMVLFVFLLVVTIIVGVDYRALADRGLLPWEPLDVPDMFSPAVFLMQIVPALLGLAFVRLFGRGAAAAIGVRAGRPGRGILCGAVAFAAVLPVCAAVLLASSLLFGLLNIPQETHPLLETVREVHANWVIPVAIIQAAILAPLAEEFAYRGILLVSLLKEIGVAGALVVSSALFAAVHLPSEPQAIPPLFILGLALGYVAYRTRSLLAPVVAHALFNTVMLTGVFVSTP